MAPSFRRWALLLLLFARVASAQAELTPPPLPPPEDTVPVEPPQPGVLVPPAINNAPLPAPEAPTPRPAEPPEQFGRRFGPMGHLAINHFNAFWGGAPILPGIAGTLGMRFALLPRNDVSNFNIAAGAFFGFESVNWSIVLSPGVRFELLGARSFILIPYLSLFAFAQLLVAPDGSVPVGARAGLGFAWNIAAATSNFWSSGGGWNIGNSASALWFLIPAALIAAVIVFGDVRVYLQPDPRAGGVLGGVSIGLGF